MDGRNAVAVSSAFQVEPYAAVAVNTVVAVIDVLDFFHHLCFWGILTRLSVFPIVIIGILADSQPPQQPANAKLCMILFDESISL